MVVIALLAWLAVIVVPGMQWEVLVLSGVLVAWATFTHLTAKSARTRPDYCGCLIRCSPTLRLGSALGRRNAYRAMSFLAGARNASS